MLRNKLSNRRILVDFLALMFGLGTWVGVNGIYVQLPLLVNNAPEGWNLPSHMVMLVQFANLGPILYTFYIEYSSWVRDRTIIYGLLGAATAATYLLAFYHTQTSTIFGNEHSTSLLTLMFIASIVGCTSSVLFTPYMRNYREIYLVSYLVGEGLSGFIPSTIALIQGVGRNPKCINETEPGSTKLKFRQENLEPRFSTETFFLLLGTLLLATFLSFIGLNNLRVAKGERVKPSEGSETMPTETNAPTSYKTRLGWTMSKQTYCLLLTTMAVVCFLHNGMLPSIQPYSCLPYGNLAYHLTITLASMAHPLAMCLGFVIKNPKVNILTNLTALALFLSGLVLYLSLKSPNPPLRDSAWGVLLVVTAWVMISGLMGFIKMGIITIFRPDPGRGLYYVGVATQIGSLIGAVSTWAVVTYTKSFITYSHCDASMNESLAKP